MTTTTTQTWFERQGERLARAAVNHRRATIAVTAVLFAVGMLGLLRARFSTDYRIFFSKEDPGLNAFIKLENVFTQTDNVLFVIKPKSGTVFQPGALEAIQELTAIGWTLPHAARVDSLSNFQEAKASGDDITVQALVARPARTLTAAELAHIQQTAVAEPLLLGSLLSTDATTAGVNVMLRLPKEDPMAVSLSANAGREAAEKIGAKHPELEIRASGMAYVNDAFMQVSIADMAVMIPLMVAVMLLVMGLILRSALATLAVASIIWLSAGLSMAIAGWLGYPLSPTSVAAPMIVLTVAVADGVHIVLTVIEGLREGKSRRAAIFHSVSTNLEAVTYTWLTTIVGFLCLNYSDAPPVTHLANMTCFGVTVAFVLSVTFLPALVSCLSLRVPPAAKAHDGMWLDRLGALVIRRRSLVLAGAAVLTLGGGLFASRLETNDQFIKYFDESIPFRRDVDFTMKNLSGIYRLEYQIASGSPYGIAEPAYLEALEGFSTWLRAQPEVQHVYSVTDILKRVHQVANGGGAEAYRIPQTRAATSEALLMYEMNLPAGLDLTDRINIDKSAARLTVTVRDMSTRQMTAFAHRSEAWLRENTPSAMWAEATGPVVIFSQLSDRNAKSMVQADFVSLALISLCMVIVLRSLKLGLISVVPNVVPIVIGYGLWWLFVGQMNIVASIAASIALGIIVDDTIHFLTKFQAIQRREGLNPEQAMRKTLAHVGPAMLSTTAILVLGFGVLTLSSFQMTSYLGWLSVIIVAIAPMADLLIAPALVLALTPTPKDVALPALKVSES
jgi:predicted RND superfamily exporter protein